MQPAGSHHVEKLEEGNYESWRMQMKSILIFNDLWGYVDGGMARPISGSEEAQWKMRDEKALALIVLSISKNELGHVRRMTTAKAAWDELARVHSSQGPVKKAILYRQLYNSKKDEKQTMMQYISNFQNKVNLLEDTGIEIPEELKTIMLLNGLPDTFENFCIAIESRDQIPGIDFIKGKLIEEEARRGNDDNQHGGNGTSALVSRQAHKSLGNKRKPERSSAPSDKGSNVDKSPGRGKVVHQKFGGRCFNCDRFGHQARDCRRKKTHGNASQAREKEEETVALSALSYSVNTDEWYIDSGATAHMCSTRDYFESMSESTIRDIRTAGKETVKATGTGTVRVDVITDGKVKTIKLLDVLYVPDLRGNLLSVSAVVSKGFRIEFSDENADIFDKKGSIVLRAAKKDKMYVVETAQPHEAKLANSAKAGTWHKRYGHLNYRDLKLLCDQNLVTGLDLPKSFHPIQCKHCNNAKIHCLPFQQSDSRARNILELIHTDICGPLQVPSLGGARYFATFIDDKSRHIDVAFLKSRGEILSAFKKYQLRVERETGRKIIKLRSDNAKEYISKNFSQHLEREGISRQLSVEYTPQQNGIAERANRTLMEMTRTMLSESNLPKSLWAEAVNTAAFLRNRCPTKVLNGMTPEELWSGRKPDVKFLRIFGSEATVLNKGTGLSKLDTKGIEAVIVGYSTESKAYRLWKRGTKTIIKSRDVRINEENVIKEFVDLPIISNKNGDEGNLENDEALEEMPFVDNESTEIDSEDDTLPNVLPEPLSVRARGRGRPKIVRTGAPGRPKKEYHEAKFVMSLSSENPTSLAEAMNCKEKEKWINAMNDEINSLKASKTWTLVDEAPDMHVISCKWVFNVKRRQNGKIDKYKARLVARGFEQRHGIDYDQIYAPVARIETIRLMLALSVEENLHIQQMDVVTAYIQGDLADEIYMKQPPMFEIESKCQKVCKLLRPIYGLKQSGREWHRKLRHKLNEIGLQNSELEPCIFHGEIDNVKLIIIVYVDDLLLFSKSLDVIIKVKTILSQSFRMKDLGPVSEILGLKIERNPYSNTIKVSQEKYIREILERFYMKECKPVSTPFIPGLKLTRGNERIADDEKNKLEGVPYRELIGSLIYLSNTSRPDLAFAAGVLSRFSVNPRKEHWQAAKHVLRYLKQTKDLGISFYKTHESLKAFVDADWAGDTDSRRSHSGNTLILAGGPIVWCSRRQKSIALSTMEAEYMALSDVVKEVVYIRRLIKEIGFSLYVKKATPIFCDNQSAIVLCKENMTTQRSKHVDIRFHFSREAQERKLINVIYIPTEKNVADIFTKPLVKDKHIKCVKGLNLSYSEMNTDVCKN